MAVRYAGIPTSYEEAQASYRAGTWRCNPPPVTTRGWDEEAWIMYIWGIRKDK